MNPRFALTLTPHVAALLALAVPAVAQTLPHNLTNGTTADATQVMQNFNTVNDRAAAAQATAQAAQTTADTAQATAAQANTAVTSLSGVLNFVGNRIGIGIAPSELDMAHNFGTIFGAGSSSGSFAVNASPSLVDGTRLVSSSQAPSGQGAQHRFTAGGLGYIDIGQDSSGNFVVESQDTNRMTVQRGGNVGIGTTAPSERLDVAGTIKIRTDDRIQFGGLTEETDPVFLRRIRYGVDETVLELRLGNNGTTTTGNDAFAITSGSGSGAGTVTLFQFNTIVSGGVAGQAFKHGGGAWASFSDARLKHDIQPLRHSLERLLQLQGRTFYYNDTQAAGTGPGQHIGFVAQEVENVFPQWIGTTMEGMKSISITGFEALTVESLRELDARNKELQAENDELRQRLASVEAMAERLADLEAAMRPLLAGKR